MADIVVIINQYKFVTYVSFNLELLCIIEYTFLNVWDALEYKCQVKALISVICGILNVYLIWWVWKNAFYYSSAHSQREREKIFPYLPEAAGDGDSFSR